MGGIGRCRYLRKVVDVRGKNFFGVIIVNADTCGVDVDSQFFRGRAGNLRKPREIKGAGVGRMEARSRGLRRLVSGAAV